MTYVLVVEDDAEKLRRVVTCLQELPGIQADNIHDARDGVTAKRLMRTRRYDLLVLDVSIPARSDEGPSPGAGLDLLHEIQERDIYQIPAHIVGLTAYEDALLVAKPHFDLDVLQLVQYDASSADWQNKLKRVAARAITTGSQATSSTDYRTHICVIAALTSPELEAILALPWGWEQHELPGDPTVYYKGKFVSEGEVRDVVAGAASRMGMQASAVLATKMIMTFRPRYLAMAGILAGIRGECELGDVRRQRLCPRFEVEH